MKRMLILGLVLVFMIQLVSAAEVCVVVDYGGEENGEPDSKCISIDEGKNGYELLNMLNWDILWGAESIYGHMLCRINDVGEDIDNSVFSNGQWCEWNVKYPESYWNFNIAENGDWVYQADTSLDGDPHYETKDGDVLGLAFGQFNSKPQMFKVNISKVYVDGDKQRESKTRGGKIVEVFPESVVEFKIELENLYDSSTDIEVFDINIEGTIEEIEDGEDIDEEISEFDLAADKEKTEELKFTIPLEVEAKDRLLRIEVKAEDDAGIRYEKEFTYDLEIEKEEHKLKILKAELDKESYKCGGNGLFSFSIINIGEEEEDVELSIINEELGLSINEEFELSNDAFEISSRYEKRFNIWLPNNASKGTYVLMITANYGDEKETANVDLVISDCEKEEVEVVKVREISGEEGTEAEITGEEEGITTIKGIVTGNLPVILTVVLVVLIVVMIALGVGFFIVRK